MQPGHERTVTTPESCVGSEVLDQIRAQDRELRQWHLRVRTWAMTEGLVVDRDGLTAVLAILLEAQRNGGPNVTAWTAARVGEMAWSASSGWAARRGVPLPAGTSSALTRFWAYLATQHAFAPGSDPLHALVAALETHTDPAQRRSGRKHPSIGKQIVRV